MKLAETAVVFSSIYSYLCDLLGRSSRMKGNILVTDTHIRMETLPSCLKSA